MITALLTGGAILCGVLLFWTLLTAILWALTTFWPETLTERRQRQMRHNRRRRLCTQPVRSKNLYAVYRGRAPRRSMSPPASQDAMPVVGWTDMRR